MRSILALMILFVAAFITTSFAQEIPTPVRAKLVSNIDRVKPGESFNLGVLFEIDPGWHIYWKYPGETGLPTKLTLNMPDSYQTSGVMWPIPGAYKKTDGGVDFGYENSVLLWTNIQVPSDAQIDKSVDIETQVSWISCKEICIPGKAKLNFSPKLGERTSSSSEALFADWSDSLPISLTDRKNPFQIEVHKIDSAHGQVKVEIKLKSNPQSEKIEYYPNPGDSLLVQNISSIKSEDFNLTEISFDVTAQDGVVLSENVLDGLIVYSDAEGKRSAVEMKIDFNDT